MAWYGRASDANQLLAEWGNLHGGDGDRPVFVRYWRQSRDSLFIYFAIAFVLEGVHRLLQAWPADGPDAPPSYLLRLVEYGLILVAIVRKNRRSGEP